MAQADQETLTQFADALKIDYLPAIRDQFNNASSYLSRLKKASVETTGKSFDKTVRTDRHQGIGARADNGALPTAAVPTKIALSYSVKRNYGRFQITGPTIAASKKSAGAVADALDHDMQTLVKDFSEDVNRQLLGAGTGQIALVNGAVTNTTAMTVDNPGSDWLEAGMTIDVVTSTGSKLIDSVEISSISSDTCTLASAQTAADNSIVVREDAWGNEVMGLRGIIDDGTIQSSIGGKSRTTYPALQSNVLDNSGTNRSLTLLLMQQGIDYPMLYGGARKEDLDILMSYGCRRSYFDLLDGNVRFVKTMKFDGGFELLSFDGRPIHVDKHCFPNEILFCNLKDIKLYKQSDIDWMDKDGNILKYVSGYDKYEAILYLYAEQAAVMFKSSCLLDDITES